MLKNKDDDFIAEVRATVRLYDVVTDANIQHTKQAGGEYKACCPFHLESTPSFFFNDDKGTFHCFGCLTGGDPIEFVRLYYSLDFKEAVAFIADMYAISTPETFLQNRRPRTTPKGQRLKNLRNREAMEAQRKVESDRKEKSARQRMLQVLREAAKHPLDLGLNYIESRGLARNLPDTVRVHPALYHYLSQSTHPALVGMIQKSRNSSPIGVQRVFLRNDGFGKAKLDEKVSPKMVLGQKKGGAVWMIDRFEQGFWPWEPCKDEEKGELWITEGLETGIALYQWLSHWHDKSKRSWGVASAVDSGNLGKLTIPPGVKWIIVAGDKDRPKKRLPTKKDSREWTRAGQEAALVAAEIYTQQGYSVEVKFPPLPIPDGEKGIDWLDMISRLRHMQPFEPGYSEPSKRRE